MKAACYVPCDFERDDFVKELVKAGFDQARPTLLLWEGVTAYLTEPAVRATLKKTAVELHPQSVIIFDYLASGESRAGESMNAFADEVANVGEPFLFMSNDVRPLLREVGFVHVRTMPLPEAFAPSTPPPPGFLNLWRVALASREIPVEC